MKKIIAAVVMAVALSACTIKVESEPTKTPEASQTPSQAPEQNSEGFLKSVRTEIPSVSPMTDDQLNDIGRQICTDLDMATTGDDVLAYTQGFHSQVSDHMTEYQTGFLIGSAVEFLCPEKSYLIDELRQEAA